MNRESRDDSECADHDDGEEAAGHSRSLSKYCREFGEVDEDTGAVLSNQHSHLSIVDDHDVIAHTDQQLPHHDKTSSSHSIAHFERRQSQPGLAVEDEGHQQLMDNVQSIMQDNGNMMCQSFAYPSNMDPTALQQQSTTQPAGSA